MQWIKEVELVIQSMNWDLRHLLVVFQCGILKYSMRGLLQSWTTEMEELQKFQSSTFDTHARQKFIEDRKTIMELSGRLQKLQNEVCCMSDSKDFQNGESVRSRNSHVTSQPVSFTSSYSWRIVLVPQRRAAMHLGHTWKIGKRFCKSTCIFISSLSSRIESMGCDSWGAAFMRLQQRKVKDQNETQIWDASLDRQPKIQSSSVEETSKNDGADQQRLQISALHFDKLLTPATVACWKIRFKTAVCICSQFSYKKWIWLIHCMN